MASKGYTQRVAGKLPDMQKMETAVVCFKEKLHISNSTAEQVISVNKRLLNEIETLKLKMDLETREYQQDRRKLLTTSGQKIKTRELEIENLKGQLKQKDEKMKNATQVNRGKQQEISELQDYIEELKEDVRVSKEYAEDIQNQLDCLKIEKSKLESGEAYKEKDDEILRLQTEMDNLKTNLATFEEEIVRSKETIAQQGCKLRLVDNDRFNMQQQFKEDLAKISQSMRRDVEKIRDVMNHQYYEMKMLREQNEDLRSDIREVKDLLVSEMQAKGKQKGNPAGLDSRFPNVKDDKHRHPHGRKKP